MEQNKNEGKMKILEMLASGAITTEEAMKLLQQFGEEEGEGIDPRQVNPNRHSDDWQEQAMGPISSSFKSIGDTIEGVVQDIMELDIDLDLADVFYGGRHKNVITYVSDPISQNIAALRLLGKNAGVEIVGYDGRQLRITCSYKAKRPDVQVMINEERGAYEVLYDYNAIRSMKIYCEVPRVFVEDIHAESKNASVKMWGVNGKNINLLTKNGSIKMEHVEAAQIAAKTRNESVQAQRVKASELYFETTNAKITAEHVAADSAHFITSNAKIATENIDIAQLYLKTSNASIKMEDIFRTGHGAGSERSIEAHTTNGGISIYVPRHVAAKLQATTTHSRVDCNLQNLLFGEMSRNYINAKSFDYESAADKAKINLSTTNSSIKIKEA